MDIDAYLVEMEVDISSAGMNQFNVVGLPDSAVKRKSRGYQGGAEELWVCVSLWHGVTINLAPAGIRKEGSAFDLPMALGLPDAWGNFSTPEAACEPSV